MKRPNFFIVGAPKCGTTALYSYLQTHSNIFMPRRKEPHFFLEDLPGYREPMTLDAYLELFSRSLPQQTAIGEATPLYLFSSVAIARIHDFDPQARIIAMLRNPVEMVRSFHRQMVYNCEEDEKDLQRAWRLQEPRRRGEHLPAISPYPQFLQYAEVARLGMQVERLLGIFPRDQVKVVLFDDFKRDPRSVYEEILDFLGVPQDGRSDFRPVNVSKQQRFDSLARSLRNPPPWAARMRDTLKRSLGLKQSGIGVFLNRINTRKQDHVPIPDALRLEMIDTFHDDVLLLGRLLERDLSHWLGKP